MYICSGLFSRVLEQDKAEQSECPIFGVCNTSGVVVCNAMSLVSMAPCTDVFAYQWSVFVVAEVPETGEEEWREHFIPVATSLLDRVLSHHTPLLPLSDPAPIPPVN